MSGPNDSYPDLKLPLGPLPESPPSAGTGDTFAFLNQAGPAPLPESFAAEPEVTMKIPANPHEQETVLPRHRSSLKPIVPGYEIIHEIGRGGMGVVYQAKQLNLNRMVALKMVLAKGEQAEEALSRFHREAAAVAKLHHPNIVQIYNIDEYNGLPFFSLEFVDGGDLAKRLRERALSIQETAAMVEAIARAVHAAHEKGILHRDLKPGNILLTKQGQPKIADFGLARHMEDSNRQTATGMILGTPSYMSPEQAAGKKNEIGPATDIYSVGAILYEMLTGRPPFEGLTPMDTLMQVMSDPPRPPREFNPAIPRDLENICLRCLKKNQAERYPTAKALAEDLHRFQTGKEVQAKTEGIWSLLGPREQKWLRRAVLALGGLYLLIVILGQAMAGFALDAVLMIGIAFWFIWPKGWNFLIGGLAIAGAALVSMQIPDYPLGIGICVGLARGFLLGAAGRGIARWTGSNATLPVLGAILLFALAFPVAVDITQEFIRLPHEPVPHRIQIDQNRQVTVTHLERCELKGQAYQRVLAHFALPDFPSAFQYISAVVILGRRDDRSSDLLDRWQWFVGPFLRTVKHREVIHITDPMDEPLDKTISFRWYASESLAYAAILTIILGLAGALIGSTLAERRYLGKPKRL